MKCAVLLAAASTLLSGPVLAQQQNQQQDQNQIVSIQTSHGSFQLPVLVSPGAGEGVALAAENERAEHDGVMIMPVPGTEWVLRTERSEADSDVTWMLPADNAQAKPIFADATCSSRWPCDEQGDHEFISAPVGNENDGAWALRHLDGVMMASSIYAPTGARAAQARDAAPSSRASARTPWIDDQGIVHEVSTKQRRNESPAAWMARHKRIVASVAEVFAPRG